MSPLCSEHAEPIDRACARCGDFACGECLDAIALCARCRERARPLTVPWEDRSRPLLARYLATCAGALLRPWKTFEVVERGSDAALVFGSPGGLLGTLHLVLSSASFFLPSRGLGPVAFHAVAWVLLLVSCLAMLATAIVIQHGLVVLAGGRGGLGRTAGVACYVAGAAAWLIAIPDGVGIPIAFLLYHVASARGIARVHGCTKIGTGTFVFTAGAILSGIVGAGIAIAIDRYG